MPNSTSSKRYVVKKFGPLTERRDYSKTVHNLPVLDLVAMQRDSFRWFIEKGIDEALVAIYPIESTNGKIRVEYLPQTLRLEMPKSEFDAIRLAKQKGTTYGFRIYATLRKIDEETAEVNDQEVLFGEIPLMTSGGTFIINGSEKVIISQLLRSPGAYFGLNVKTTKSSGDDLYNRLEMIPKLGIWLDLFHKSTLTNGAIDFVKISIDKNKSISVSTFLRSMGMSKEAIIELFGDTPLVHETIKRDGKKTEDEALEYVHGILKKGDRITDESKRNLYANLLFNKRRYDLSKTGRFTLNRKLNLIERLEGAVLAQDLKAASGNILYRKGDRISLGMAEEIQEAFRAGIFPLVEIPGITTDIYGTQVQHLPDLAKRTKVALVKVWPDKRAMDRNDAPVNVIANDPNATEEILLISDIIAAVSYHFNLTFNIGLADDPDSLINKRISPIGELLQNQLLIGLTKMERNARERMSAREAEKITPKNITNNKLIYNQFKSFFNSSQLSQFMDQMNPLAELSNKRRVTSLGPGGLNRDTASFEVRDVHTTHYGRICPIETPEGPNIGLILNFAIYARLNELGFIETPYFPVKAGKAIFDKPVYLTAADERGKTFAQSSVTINAKGLLADDQVIVRKDSDYMMVNSNEVDYIDVSSKQMTSVAASAIPFLENDDANRALMGANMQRQSVPLLAAEAPLVGTGIEADIAHFAAANLRATEEGVVTYVDSESIKVKPNNGGKVRTYQLRSFERSNQGSVITQRPLVKINDAIAIDQLLTDGPAFDSGEMALGKNVLVAFSTWNGYNFEDAIILSERLVKDDVYTSLHIEEQAIEFRTSKIGDDELTTDVPNVSNYSKRNLSSQGIVQIGAEVEAGDVLVGRVSPKGEDNPTPEEKLIAAIFTQKQKNVKDTSLKVKHGHSGTVIDVQVLSRETGDTLPDDIIKIVKVLIAQKRKIKVGDKMAGRHGNKGVISRVLPIEDMPHLADGTPIDIMLNPQGVPSRMNIGQVLELHLGLAAKKLNVKFASPVFDGIKYHDINAALKEAALPSDGKFDLFDPISGRKFDNKVSVGVMYMLKLAHMVDDKMHARAVGPYSLITQQPLGGKSQNGGQRFGEMETWAIESYGATNVLQELLTYKSDNIEGRNKVYNALASGAPLPHAGTPESFNVLAYELRGLGIKLAIETDGDYDKTEGDN